MDVRAMVEHEINNQIRRLHRDQQHMITRLQAGHSLEYGGAERLQRQEKLTDLWLNVDKVIKKADTADAVYTIREVLEGVLERVDDRLTTYTVRQTTSLFSVWQDTVAQDARVDFRQEISNLVRLAEREEAEAATE